MTRRMTWSGIWWCLGASGSLALGGCISKLPLDDSPCPCPASAGFVCCSGGAASHCVRSQPGETVDQTCSGSLVDAGPNNDGTDGGQAPQLIDALPAEGGQDAAAVSPMLPGLVLGRCHRRSVDAAERLHAWPCGRAGARLLHQRPNQQDCLLGRPMGRHHPGAAQRRFRQCVGRGVPHLRATLRPDAADRVLGEALPALVLEALAILP
jgi:hypothetical protein